MDSTVSYDMDSKALMGTNHPGYPTRDISELLQHIMCISQQTLDEAQAQKQALGQHRMRPALFSVLCQIKGNIIKHIKVTKGY